MFKCKHLKVHLARQVGPTDGRGRRSQDQEALMSRQVRTKSSAWRAKWSPCCAWRPVRTAKWSPRGAQDSRISAQEASKSPQVRPKRRPRGSSWPQEPPSSVQEAPKRLQVRLQRPKLDPRPPKLAPRCPQEAPSGSQEAPKSSQVRPKRRPRAAKCGPRTSKYAPRGAQKPPSRAQEAAK